MRNRSKNKRRKINIYEKYRRILKMPKLEDKEIDEMRKNLSLLAQTICKNLWGKKFY
jgi:hypothetical protein